MNVLVLLTGGLFHQETEYLIGGYFTFQLLGAMSFLGATRATTIWL